jgi:hypothetical protein
MKHSSSTSSKTPLIIFVIFFTVGLFILCGGPPGIWRVSGLGLILLGIFVGIATRKSIRHYADKIDCQKRVDALAEIWEKNHRRGERKARYSTTVSLPLRIGSVTIRHTYTAWPWWQFWRE